jgi:hypothetical protein
MKMELQVQEGNPVSGIEEVCLLISGIGIWRSTKIIAERTGTVLVAGLV